MTDQSGLATSLAARRGRPQLVSMFYTSCRYICPLIIDSAFAVEKQLTPAQRAWLGVTLISMDPGLRRRGQEGDVGPLSAAQATAGCRWVARWRIASHSAMPSMALAMYQGMPGSSAGAVGPMNVAKALV